MTSGRIQRIAAVLLMVLSISVIAVDYQMTAYAAEDLGDLGNVQLSMFMKTLQPVDAKAEPNDDAETIFSYDEGSYVYVTGETDNGWYIAFYQGQTGYIKNVPQELEIVQDVQARQGVLEAGEIDIEALDEELAAQELEGKLLAEEMERYRAEARRSRIWGTIIVLLVIGIFAVGIISTVRSEKKKKEGKDMSEDQQENSHNGKGQPEKNDVDDTAQDVDIIDLDKE